MKTRTVRLQLNRFPVVPNDLRPAKSRNQNTAASSVEVDLARLYHHYWIDNYPGHRVPDPDPTQFEYLRFLTEGPAFRFAGDGLGVFDGRRHRSQELGQAFLRHTLHDFLRVPYFAHLKEVLGRQEVRGLGDISIRRIAAGDTPDYLCARSVSRAYLAEAKGRQKESISFASKAFQSWRSQFQTVAVYDAAGNPKSLKGYIAATRFAAESQPRVHTTVFLEDPDTEGEDDPEWLGHLTLARTVLSCHYAHVLRALRLELPAEALLRGFQLPGDLFFNLPLWRCMIPPFEKEHFVGGLVFSAGDRDSLLAKLLLQSIAGVDSVKFALAPFAQTTFFGVKERTLRRTLDVARRGEQLWDDHQAAEVWGLYTPSDFSILADATVLSNPAYFDFVGTEVF